MTIYDWISNHPNNHLRIIRYVPAPDVMDAHGNLTCGGEGTSTVVFDSSTGDGDLAPDLMLKEITNSPDAEATDEEKMDPDYVWELEYIPDEFWF
jgi:hypothetical protein